MSTFALAYYALQCNPLDESIDTHSVLCPTLRGMKKDVELSLKNNSFVICLPWHSYMYAKCALFYTLYSALFRAGIG